MPATHTQPPARTALRAAIVAFCVFHMVAVAAYLLPRDTGWRNWNLAAGTLFNATRGYILEFSQWQKWDIFSPDPLRRSPLYTLEVYENGTWRVLKTIDFASLPPLQRAKELKILERMEEGWSAETPTYLDWECRTLRDAAGLPLRLQAQSYMLPDDLPTLSHLDTGRLGLTDVTIGQTRCPLPFAS